MLRNIVLTFCPWFHSWGRCRHSCQPPQSSDWVCHPFRKLVWCRRLDPSTPNVWNKAWIVIVENVDFWSLFLCLGGEVEALACRLHVNRFRIIARVRFPISTRIIFVLGFSGSVSPILWRQFFAFLFRMAFFCAVDICQIPSDPKANIGLERRNWNRIVSPSCSFPKK